MVIFGAGIEILVKHPGDRFHVFFVYGNAVLKFPIGVNAFAASAIKSNENR